MLAGIDKSLDPIESMMMHRYSPIYSCPAFTIYNVLVTLPSGLLVSTEGGKSALETSAVVPQTNDKGSVPLAIQVSSISSPSSTIELLGCSIIVKRLDSVDHEKKTWFACID